MIITEEQIIETQKEWGAGIVEIGALKNNRVQCEKHTNDFLDKHYTFESNTTLFKPTRCSQKQFRPTKELALSYFIAGDNRACDEDKGFAINPWTNVDFENFNIVIEENRAIAMGNYYFTDLDGHKTKVEYTFGYKVIKGKLKINLHHSSLPYTP